MKDWFEWNGTKCTEFGIHVSEQPPISLPKERVSNTVIPGRSGSVNLVEGEDIYDDLVLACECFISNEERISEIAAWLKGAGTVRFASRDIGYYDARISNQIDLEKIMRGRPNRKFTVTFRCSPFMRLVDSPVAVFDDLGHLDNPTAFSSFPLIRVTTTSNARATVMIGRYTVFIEGYTGDITIDTENMMAYNDDTNLSRYVYLVNDEWPILEPKSVVATNSINFIGSASRVVIQPKWRCL